MAIVKDVKAPGTERHISQELLVVNLRVALTTGTMVAALVVSNIGFPTGLTTTRLNDATPTPLSTAFHTELTRGVHSDTEGWAFVGKGASP